MSATAPQRPPVQPRLVRRLGLASFFQDVASEMVYPLLPAFLTSLGGGAALLGAMESAADGVVAFVKGWAGRRSDRIARRKPFVLFGYAASAAARPLLAATVSSTQLVALRVWDRFAKGVRSAPRDALIGDAVAPERRAAAFAYQRGLDHLGAAVGPLVATALLAGGVSLRVVFLTATLPALAGVATVLFGVPGESPSTSAPSRSPTTEGPPAVAIAPRLLSAALLFGLANASDAFLLLRAAELGLPQFALPLLWSALHVVRWSCAAAGGRLADRLGARRSLVLGWSAYGAVYLGFGFAPSLVLFVALVGLYAAQAGLVEGAERAFAVELGRGVASGSALGAWQRASGFGALGASLLFGLLWQEVSAAAAFSSAAAAGLLAAALLALSAQR